MKEKLSEQVERCLKSHSRKKVRARVLRVLALAVAFVTVYMLIAPAVTLSNETTCGLEAHTHTEKCYELRMVEPQPEIVCGVENSADIVLHTHDEYCYDAEGQLICALPEQEGHVHSEDCYQEQRELTCTQAQEQGHTHTAQCYAYEKGELICGHVEGEGHVHGEECYTTIGGSLICTEPESEGHTHGPECYTTVRTEVLTCGQSESNDVYHEETGELLSAGHTHDSSCYTVEETEELTCTQPESAGHTHGPECYEQAVTTLTCNKSEGEGHVHDDSCYEWTEQLVCTEPERESGHVHTDECYTTTRVLACTREELVPHIHGESCYDADGELICGKPQVIEHQHTAACIVIPEGGPVEKEVLVCGKEEHVHTDECYQEIVPELGEKYYCGLVEHTHTADCWFDSGELRCTFVEHTHTAECLDPNFVPRPPEGMGDEAVWIDDIYEHETEEFHMTFHVRGYAVPEEDGLLSGGDGKKPLPSATGAEKPEPTAEPVSGPDAEPEQTAEPEASPEPTSTTEPEPAPEPAAEPAGEPVSEPAPEGGEFTAPRGDDGAEPDGSDGEPEQSVEVVFDVEAQDADFANIAFADLDAEVSDAGTETAGEAETAEGETLLKKTITLTAMIDGVKYDLSGCSISTEIRPTDFLLNTLADMAAANMPENDELTESGEQAELEIVMAMTSMADEVLSVTSIAPAAMYYSAGDEAAPDSESGNMTVQADLPENDSSFDVIISSLANPEFTVEYYAYLKTVDRNAEGGMELDVIDTSGGKMPVNGDLNLETISMSLNMTSKDDNGNNVGYVNMRDDVQPLYKTHKFKYAKAPGLQYVNIIGDKVNADITDDNSYELAEIWVQLSGTDDVNEGKAKEIKTETVTNDDGTTSEVKWAVVECTEANPARLTNLEQTAQNNSRCILIRPKSVIRLVYKTTDKSRSVSGTMYDYDISKGPNTATTIDTANNGINSYPHKEGYAHYAFGNRIAGTQWGEEIWNDGSKVNKLNAANNDAAGNATSFSGCTFGMVQGIANENVIFSDGIEGPALFGTEPADGKTQYGDSSMTFIRQGDTYTLSSVSVAGYNSGAYNLDRFISRRFEASWIKPNGYKIINSNDFWPMDGVLNADPKFGAYSGDVKYNGYNKTDNMPTSDDNIAHNSYFGMHFAVDFELADAYVGPLEYWFFGDDDMWVFLTPLDENGEPSGTPELICDIGGVHSAVGEYVDLWDHIERDRGLKDVTDLAGEKEPEDQGKKKYRLDFFYTERGASGSTCWMQFTLPTVAGVDLDDTIDKKVTEDTGALWIEKKVTNTDKAEHLNRDFKFTIKLTEPEDKGESEGEGEGEGAKDQFVAYKKRWDGKTEDITDIIDNTIATGQTFTLKSGERLVIAGLPKGTKYEITEAEVTNADETPAYNTTVTTTTNHIATDGKGENWSTETVNEGRIASGEISGSTQITAQYVNESTEKEDPPGDEFTGILQLEKKVEGVRGGEQKFKFTIDLDFSKAEPSVMTAERGFVYDESGELTGYYPNLYMKTDLTDGKFLQINALEESGSKPYIELKDGKGSFTPRIKDGEAIRLTQLPPGTIYTVTEDRGVFEDFNVHYVQSFEAVEPSETAEGENDAQTAAETSDMQTDDAQTDTETDGTQTDDAQTDKEADGTQTDAAAGTADSEEQSGPTLPEDREIPGEEASGTIEAGRNDKLECVNSAKYTFPETGASIGNSAMTYTLAGTLLLLAVCCLWYRKRPRGRGAAN